jgi:hypothetical protein
MGGTTTVEATEHRDEVDQQLLDNLYAIIDACDAADMGRLLVLHQQQADLLETRSRAH